MGLNKGKKFGRELVRAVSDPLDGALLGGSLRVDGPNEWLPLTSTNPHLIEGVVIKALATNVGTVYITGAVANEDGFPLAAGETVSIAIDDLNKVKVWVPTADDGVAWLAIEQARD